MGNCVSGASLPPPGYPYLASGGALCGPGCWWRPQLCLLQAVSSNPYVGDGRGAASLRLLSVLHQDIHPALGQRWATAIPLLLEHLDGEAWVGTAAPPLTPIVAFGIKAGHWRPGF